MKNEKKEVKKQFIWTRFRVSEVRITPETKKNLKVHAKRICFFCNQRLNGNSFSAARRRERKERTHYEGQKPHPGLSARQRDRRRAGLSRGIPIPRCRAVLFAAGFSACNRKGGYTRLFPFDFAPQSEVLHLEIVGQRQSQTADAWQADQAGETASVAFS